jgi:glyceraldehyde-3-phosphate dehydrogenase (NADP+)
LYRIASLLEQREYLCDGVIREWSGPQQDMLSPICGASGTTARQKRIESYPLLTAQQALETLGAACRAFDNGRGAWPWPCP